MREYATILTITMTACLFAGCATGNHAQVTGDLVTGTGADGDTELVVSPFCESLRAGNRILEEEGWRNWDMAPIYGPDGSVHLFVGRWPVKGSWLKNAQIDHYKAERPEGPYEHVETVFAKKGVTYYNPQINKVDDLYVMVYSYKAAGTPNVQQQVGLATSKSLNGPWKQSPHNPILYPSLKPGTPNCLHASNATFVKAPDGKYRIYYKSMSDKSPRPYMRTISMAVAGNIEGPYENFSGNPVISYAEHGLDIEDPYAFYYRGSYYMILEDRMGVAGHLTGKEKPEVITKGGARHGLIYKSKDGISWGRPEVGYQANSFYFPEKTQRFERPHILWKDGEPDYLFLALNKGKYNTSSGAVLKVERQSALESRPASNANRQVEPSIEWAKFLSRHDMHWSRMPREWNEAPFLGNGMMGTMVRQLDDHTVRWDVGRGDVQDHRPGGGMYGTCRLPIGYFMLKTVGAIKGGTMKLALWNAEATGKIETDKGFIRWRSIVHAERDVIVTEIEPSEGERGCQWEWEALEAISPRHAFGKTKEGYKDNPPSVLTQDGDVNVCIQPLSVGGETATAWIVDKQKGKSVLTVSVAHSYPETMATQEAVDAIKSTRDVPMDKLIESHRRWWHAYYPKSFVSIPDTQWESFYWIQMYKLASATRANGMVIDNQGPWLQPTPWPGIWWNLNVQLSYWPTYGSNRLELGNSLCRTLYSKVSNLIENVPEQYRHDSSAISRATGQHCIGGVGAPDGNNAPEIGLLLWACHNSWLHYRHSMDDETLRDDLFPLLRRAVNYYLHFVTKDADGTLHLPKTYSPEYNYEQGPDCNFDLALLRWGCGALIASCARLDIDDPLLPKWRDILAGLTDYPADENGYMIADGVPFARKHRHYSHLLMLYPLYLRNIEQAGANELALNSLRHWQSFGRSTGYALTGASSISAAFGHGNDALKYLDGLKSFLEPNTMYKEAGPVIETPLSGAQCIHDMLIQSWGDSIRVFPAAPDAWPDMAFHDLRTEGAFLVSAVREDGRTRFVRVKSLAGEPCKIRPGLSGAVRITGDLDLDETSPGLFTLNLKKGEEAILWSGGEIPDLKIAPVPATENGCNSFGLK